MTATKAMRYEKTPIISKRSGGSVDVSKRLTSRWAAQDVEKHLNRLSSLRIVHYLYKRHSLIVWQVLTVVAFSWAILRHF